MRLNLFLFISFFLLASACTEATSSSGADDQSDNLPDITGYPIVDTDQSTFFDNSSEISAPSSGEAFYGQDAQYSGNQPSYTDNGDGTVTDNITGLMWSQSSDLNDDGIIDVDDKLSYDNALAGAASFDLAGYFDWRLPTIKEAYSLILFSGRDVSGYNGSSTDGLIPFIDTEYFEFGYGDTDAGERIIDSQFATSTKYVSTTMNGDETMFGTNLADGRIKGYGTSSPNGGGDKLFYVMYVRGNETYGINDLVDNGDGTITDNATGLMWMQDDNGEGVNWADALNYAENLDYAGYSDWRLPNIKELQSIVDYTRSPETSSSAALDPIFNISEITNEAGETDYPHFWSGTTHANWIDGNEGSGGAYISFGRAMGYMGSWIDVHGAGAQRSDPKIGDPADYPTGHGPQGDAIRIYNYVRLVRDASINVSVKEEASVASDFQLNQNYPNPFNPSTSINIYIPTESKVKLEIFNIDGQFVETLLDQELSVGSHNINWDASGVPSGTYFYRLSNDYFSQTKNMTYIK